MPILGMVQNMSTFVCTNCGHEHDIFGLDGPFIAFPRSCFGSAADDSQERGANAKRWAFTSLGTFRSILRSVAMQIPAGQPWSPAQTVPTRSLSSALQMR